MAIVRYNEPFRFSTGRPAVGARVYVYNHATEVLAALYEDSDGLVAATNPITVDADGVLDFYVEDGTYDLEVNGARLLLNILAPAGIEFQEQIDDLDTDLTAETAARAAGDVTTATNAATDATTKANAAQVAAAADATTKANAAELNAQTYTDTAVSTRASQVALDTHTSNTSNPHSTTKAQVGLGNVDNTADSAKPVSAAQQAALDAKAPLNSPAFTGTPTGITKTHVGLGNVDNTADTAKPVSTATQTALNLKANLASPTFTGTVAGVTASMVGLGNVNNTSDASKPISTATQSALDAKAPIASPTFTGTVSGVSKSHVGLGNVDNTSDVNKPVSTAQQTALDDKVTKGTLMINVKDHGATGDGTTDDTTSINAALDAAIPGTIVFFPAPTVAYRITDVLTPPSGVIIAGAGRSCEIRQATQMKPVFDLFNVNNITVRDFTLTNSSGSPATPGSSFRGDNGYAYSAGVWANGTRIALDNLRIVNFGMGVYFNASNGTVNNGAGMRIGNSARNIETVGVNHGILFMMQEDLSIDGLKSYDHVDSSAGVNPIHAVYGTGTETDRSKNVNVTNCLSRNITDPLSSCAYQFKYIDGLTFENLQADNCNGFLNVIDCNDVNGDGLQSTNTIGSATGGYAIWFQVVGTRPTRVTLDNVAVQMTTANAAVLGLIADDARVSNMRVIVNRTAAQTGSYDTIIRGNRIILDGYQLRNIGTANGNGILVGSGASIPTSDVSIVNPEIDGSVNVADFDQACTGVNVAEYAVVRQRRITNNVGTHCRPTTSGSLGGTTSFRVVRLSVAADGDLPTVGEFVPRREYITSNQIAATSGTLVLRYFTADKTEAINTLTAYTGTVAAAATPTICRMGIYAVADNGDITLVASTPNDTALFTVINTAYSKGLSATFNKVAGVRYATALLVVSGAAVPTWHGQQLAATNPTNAFVRDAPAIVGRVLSQTDLPASVVAASIVGYQGTVAMKLT